MQQPSDTDALADLRVLDLAEEGGAYCGKLLADMGADVLVVEPPEGAAARRRGPFLEDRPHPEGSLFFWHYNLNKRSITLNLEARDGRDLFKRLAARADVVIETFPPGYLESLGLGYTVLRESNPGTVVASITPFGQTGPRRHWKGSDLVSQALGGMANVCGDPDRWPVAAAGNQASNVASTYAAIAILMAVHARGHTGQGQHIDISMQEAIDSVVEVVNTFYIYTGVIPGRQGTRHGLRGPGPVGDVFPCADGHICMLAPEPHQLRALFQWMGEVGMAGDLLDDERWVLGGLRRDPAEELHMYNLIKTFFLGKTREEIFAEAQRRGVTLSPVTEPSDLTENLQLNARSFWVEVEHPELRQRFTYPGAPAIYHGSPWRVHRRPPLAGEHNREIFVGELGISAEELRRLAGAGVV